MHRTFAVHAQLDVGRGLGVGARADGVFVVVHDLHTDRQAGHQGFQRAVALAVPAQVGFALAFARHFDFHRAVAVFFLQTMADQRVRSVGLQVFTLQQGVDLRGGHLQAHAVGFGLDYLAEFDLHATRQADVVFLLQQVGDTAFARLAVHTDHRFVAATDVGRVDRQVRHFPQCVGFLLGEALADCVLVGAGERSVYQIADIRVTWVHLDLVALLDDLAHAVDVREVQLRVHALGVEVQRDGYQVDVTGTLAVAEQAAFDAIRAGHQAQLGGRDAGATVVVGVQADDHAVTTIDMATEPLDLVGIDVRRGALDGGGQVEDHLVLRRRVPHLDHRVTYFLGELQFGSAEGLRRVFEGPLGFRLLGGVFDEQLGRVDRDGLDAFLVLVEHDTAEGRRGGVVQVHDGLFGAAQGFEGACDQVFTALGQHLDGGVLGDVVVFDQGAYKVEVGLRSGRERGFDFLHADGDQGLPETQFFHRVHRFDQRLVAIAQVGAAPDRRAGDGFRRPGAVRNIDGRERAVLRRRVFEHAHREILCCRGRKKAACRRTVIGYEAGDEADRFSLAVVR